MLNILMVENDISYSIELINALYDKNTNIRICGISQNITSALEILNKRNDINIILLNFEIS